MGSRAVRLQQEKLGGGGPPTGAGDTSTNVASEGPRRRARTHREHRQSNGSSVSTLAVLTAAYIPLKTELVSHGIYH